MPVKVCFISEPSPITYISGQSVRFRTLLEYLQQQDGDEVELVTAEIAVPNPPENYKGVPVHYTYGVPFFCYPMITNPVDWTMKTWRVIWNQKPDIIHVSSPSILVFSAWIISRLFQIPMVASYHTHIPVYAKTYFPMGINVIIAALVWVLIWLVHCCADLTLVSSPQIQEEFEENGIPRCEVWPKGIDTVKFHPKFRSTAMRHRMSDRHPDDYLLVYIGRLGHEKRIKDLRAVLESMPVNTRLCIVGSGPQEKELHRYFKGTRTVFTGLLLGEDLVQAFSSGDCFVMPSDSETLGFVCLESMASGVPVVAADAGGIPDIIEDGETGFLVPPGDIKAFVGRLEQLQADPELRERISESARKDVERYSWDASMHKVRFEFYRMAKENFYQRYEQRAWRFLKSIIKNVD